MIRPRTLRMLPFLDYSVIRENPKVFLGYSDSTVTHFAFLKAGVISFYGPSIMAGFDENGGLARPTWRNLCARCSSRLRHPC
jgi:muramoyltetrapeptide carboxypeptidase LdcA involved in peptidoglycan recycling